MTRLENPQLPSELILLVLEHLCGARPSLLSRTVTWRTPPVHQAAWYSISRIGGLLVGHHYCTKPVGSWCTGEDLSTALEWNARLEGRADQLRAPWAYHLVVCTLENWMPLLLRSAEWCTITHLTITLYPSLWIDQDLFEHVLRTLLSQSALPLLQHLVLLVGHDGFAVGSRVRRIDRSRAIAAAASRIADPRLRVLGAPTHFGTAGQGLAEDVEKYTRRGWEARIRGEKGPWIGMDSIAAFTPLAHEKHCSDSP
ncbi:hypothetical protein CBOM_03036 [Ceraceosorus bombacis]|uniref:Uncharacterized protein n=1 Tax=Ceraceosorus bombacis TaxID=401625 RepID=A0A0P1BMV6_9BASI|nr:hypothetical protein CBOM_03036 [Ceraceosorus bombacis]